MTTNIDKNVIKAAIFDLDGTLLDTLSTIEFYLNKTLSSHGLPSVSRSQTMAFVGNGAAKLIERAMEAVGADKTLFDSIYKSYNESYNADPYYLTEPYDGISELIEWLKSSGIPLAVLSNKPDFAVKAAVDHFFPDSFDIVLGGREALPLKPDPTALIEIISDLGLVPDEICYIGDSEVDVLTAKNASVKNAFFVTWGFRTPDQLLTAGASILCHSTNELFNKITKR